ncbi:MAG: Mov34/MPN/PAD-1 family protein [Candidatus Thiodiazotropha lotti]
MERHQQINTGTSEAGGQLFGTVTPDVVRILHATGPYHGDDRSRHRYRSAPQSAQLSITKEAERGRIYLGEWHTHAEGNPYPSRLDVDVMETILTRSKLNTTSLLLAIVGQMPLPRSLCVWSFSKEGALKWSHVVTP